MFVFDDKTGRRFGRLVVLKLHSRKDPAHLYWKCRCDCGNSIITTNLTMRRSCGCARLKDYVGRRFGRLLVLERAKSRNGYPFWRCRCDCGRVVVRTNITSAKTCGCGQRERVIAANKLRAAPDSAFKLVLRQYKGNAASRGLAWELTDEQFRAISSSPCYYTGRPPQGLKRTHPHNGGSYSYSGIDRLDSSKPYTLENCVPCCSEINYFKSVMPHDKFIALCCEVAAHVNARKGN